jgi:enolase
MDVAASEFYKDGKYDLDFKNPASDPAQHLSGEALADLYVSFIQEYPSMYCFASWLSLLFFSFLSIFF